jgi:peroxiredoxin
MKAKKFFATLAFAIVLTACGPGVDMAAIAANGTAEVGQIAPAFELTDSTGKTRSLAEFAGKTVVLEWNNPGCPFVKKHYGSDNMQNQQRDATAAGVVWLTINSGAPGKQGHMDAEEAEEFREESGSAQTAYLLDPQGTVGRAYGAMTTPHMYIVDAEGVLRYAGGIDSHQSADPDDIPDATQYVPQALAELAAGKAVSMPVTRPYGCDVKYAN